MRFYQENCSSKILYYVHLEHSNVEKNKCIFICIKEWKSNNYPCGLCKRQVSNVGFIDVTSLV